MKNKHSSHPLVEITQESNIIKLKSLITDEMRVKLATKSLEYYQELLIKIDSLVAETRELVTSVSPYSLLLYAADMSIMNRIGISSECQADDKKVHTSYLLEYIQSIIISSPFTKDSYENKEKIDLAYAQIEEKFMVIHNHLNDFYLCWSFKVENEKLLDKSSIFNIIEGQLNYLVRGNRYQYFEREYHTTLLKAHSDIIAKLFDMSIETLIDGYVKLCTSLVSGKVNALYDIKSFYDKIEHVDCDKMEKIAKNFTETQPELIENFLGTGCYDVHKVTDWDIKFINELSFEVNSYSDFFNNQEFSGWPITDLPIKKKPFIELDNTSYCFDYYSLADNFYRAVQKTVTRLQPDYKWNDFQQLASETMVEDIFKQILPNCTTYRDNYYPKNASLKQLAENDLLIHYENTMIIVEVKAGSFVYTPPITDFEAHIKSYKALIEKADHQCHRTLNYLQNNPNPIIYAKDKTSKIQFNMAEITNIYTISITVDNINTFAAKSEKLNFLNLQSDTISISIDDLMVYRDYFDSPFLFLHFLEQRKKATLTKQLALNDELDHLGMYIEHNLYTMHFENQEYQRMQCIGYRESLDIYFNQLHFPLQTQKKPQINIPPLFQSLLPIVENSKIKDKTRLTNYLLDLSYDAKVDFENNVTEILKKQPESARMMPIYATASDASFSYTCFVNQPNVPQITDEEKIDYVLSTILYNKEKNRLLIDLYFDSNEKLVAIKDLLLSTESLPHDKREELLKKGQERAKYRFNKNISSEVGKKLGRNSPCPCQSGKKYKKCCLANM